MLATFVPSWPALGDDHGGGLGAPGGNLQGLDGPRADPQAEFLKGNAHLARPHRQRLRRAEGVIGMRLKQVDELIILVVVNAPQGDRPRPGNHHERQAGIGLMPRIIDAREELADFIGGNEGALLDGFARPLRA